MWSLKHDVTINGVNFTDKLWNCTLLGIRKNWSFPSKTFWQSQFQYRLLSGNMQGCYRSIWNG